MPDKIKKNKEKTLLFKIIKLIASTMGIDPAMYTILQN